MSIDEEEAAAALAELEQAARRVMLTQAYHGDRRVQPSTSPEEQLARLLTEGRVDAKTLLARYCGQLYRRHGSYEEVARITDLDRRTARKYVVMHGQPDA